MAEISKLQIAELDFDTIKNNLKDYFNSQAEFTDHDFGGSAVSVLLDILSYNTYYNAYYLNMLASESFLDSAQLRDSVVAKASMLGYTPQSATGSKANVSITVTPGDSPASITIDKNTQFTSSVNGTSYVFCTANSATITPVDGVYTASGVTLTQGIPLTFRYTANTANTEQKFLLPNANTDTDTLTVTVQESATDTNTSVYTKATDITTVNSTSNVYFLSESSEGQFKVEFGDGVIGRKPVTGNIVLLAALVTEGDEVNGANTFSASGTVGGYSTVSVAVTNAASGGSDKENLESIKFNAPKNFETQNRAVTTDDYKKIVEGNVSGLDSVSVWGGQDNATPEFGKVFISAKPTGATSLSTSQIAEIKSAATDFNMVSITPEVVDPDIIDLIFSVTVKYDSRKTTLSSGAVAEAVIDTIQTYKTNNLLKFGSIFRYSTLSTNIDNTETSIISNLTTITAKKGITPSTTTEDSYTISFNNAAYHPAAGWSQTVVESGGFYLSGNTNIQYIDDDGNGNIRTFYLLGGTTKTITNATAGTINYSTGQVVLTSFNITAIVSSSGKLDITVKPDSNDVIPVRNQVVEIDTISSSVTAEVDTFATGESTAGVGYTTKSSTAAVGSAYTTS